MMKNMLPKSSRKLSRSSELPARETVRVQAAIYLLLVLAGVLFMNFVFGALLYVNFLSM